MKPYLITIRQHGHAPRYLHAIAGSAAGAICGVIEELPFGSFVTCAPASKALPAFHDAPAVNCASKLNGGACVCDPACSDVCAEDEDTTPFCISLQDQRPLPDEDDAYADYIARSES